MDIMLRYYFYNLLFIVFSYILILIFIYNINIIRRNNMFKGIISY